MKSAPEIRPVSPSDWQSVRRLHGRVAAVYRSPAAWHWRYADAQDGTPASTGVVAIAANHEVAAFVGGRHRWAWSNGQRVQILVVHDRLGTAEIAVNTTASLRFEPDGNDGAPAGSNTHAADILWRVCSLSPLGDAPGCTGLVRPTDFVEPGWDQLCQPGAGNNVTSLLKDRDYLAWRYVQNPGEGASARNPYWRFAFWSVASPDPLGFVVLRPSEGGAAILVDAVWPQHVQVLRDGMRQIADFLMARGVRAIRTAATAANPGMAYLHNLGFTATQALRTEPQTLQIDGEGILTGAPWSITLGDSLLY